MNKLLNIINKNEKIVVGLMSGTSLDGIDTVIMKITGNGMETKIETIDFKTYAYNASIRNEINKACLIDCSNVESICKLNFKLGELFANAVIDICKENSIDINMLDIIGSHGQTIYHIPGSSTLQIGEPAVIAEKTGVVTVADFRVRDVAAGGHGAPLVPYTEYILYRDKYKTRALQNIGGIGNVTLLPANAEIEKVFAFDTGPGNMMIDACIEHMTNGYELFDKDGYRASQGKVSSKLLNELLSHPFINKLPPKTTGREEFGFEYTKAIIDKYLINGVSILDILTTFTYFTVKSIALSYKNFILCHYTLDEVIIGGGGSHNKTLIKMLKNELKNIKVITQEELGYSSDAKEAIAFGILANEAICGNCNNLPNVTGAKNSVIMGKILI